ncbi:CYIR protein [Plasmodium coatneyi]|uniref:CYIR protein n=1 Tax=Plasmodium coatneyi TaxID=208452 RepID=A0A1B1DSV5_9APIC|nr:CYIR protein [Plasmodium coatneyi]ANQ05719.1 CYIR protein [Plasmodium coatneyi]
MTPSSTGTVLGDEELSKLPSNSSYYNEFREVFDTCGYSATEAVKTALHGHTELGGHMQEIAHAQCFAHAWQGTGDRGDKPCTFFYYWLGDILWKNIDSSTVLALMRKIYEEYRKKANEERCKIIYDNISEGEFKQRKLAYEYYNNYGAIKEQREQRGTKCNAAYHTYLKERADAYNAIRTDCEGKDTEPYCSDFNTKWKKYKEPKPRGQGGYEEKDLEILECTPPPKPKPNPNPNQAGSSGSFSDYDYGSASSTVAPAAVSAAGGIAAIGLPAVMFLLYKYTNLFSGLRNSFGGSNSRSRKKRSIIRNELNTLSEDSATEYGTDYSTIASSVASTEDNSTIYDGPTSRGRTNNGRRPGNRGRNISYQRM